MARYEPADVQHSNRAGEALERNVAELLQLGYFVDRRCHALRHQNLAVFGFGAEPRRHICDGADRSVVEASLKTDPPQCGIALGDPDAEADFMSAGRP